MTQVVNEEQIFQGGARLPSLTSKPGLSTDGSGNLQAAARSSVAFTTASLAALASENDNVTVAKIAKAIKVVTDHPARVRAYSTSAYRTNDATRSAAYDPSGDHGLLLEVVTTSTLLSVDLCPAASLHNMDGSPAATIYFRVQNLDTVSRAVTVTLTVLLEEN